MKRLLFALFFVTGIAHGQIVPHVTQPFSYLWDYPTANIAATPGQQQINHFEFQLDTAAPVNIAIPPSASSANVGFSTFKISADVALALGPHTFNVIACPSATLSTAVASGCVAAIPFPFVLDPKALPSAQRLGVGL